MLLLTSTFRPSLFVAGYGLGQCFTGVVKMETLKTDRSDAMGSAI